MLSCALARCFHEQMCGGPRVLEGALLGTHPWELYRGFLPEKGGWMEGSRSLSLLTSEVV